MLFRNRIKCFLIATFCMFPLASQASTDMIQQSATAYLGNLTEDANDGETIADPDALAEDIATLFQSFNPGVESPTQDDIAEFMATIWERKLISVDAARALAQRVLPRATNEDFAEMHTPAMLLLHAYALEAGMCISDPVDPESLFCSYSVGNGAIDAVGAMDGADGNEVAMARPAPEGSELAYILAPAECQKATSTPMMTSSTSSTSTMSTDDLVSTECADFSYYTTYAYRYKVEWYGTTRVWAEGLGFAMLYILEDNADSLMAQIPAALRCGSSCIVNSILSCLDELVKGDVDEALLCVARKASKRSYKLHNASYIQHVQSRDCGIRRAEAEDRPYFEAYQNGDFDDQFQLPEEAHGFVSTDDLRFRTHFQHAPTDEDGTNLFPQPTSSALRGTMVGPVEVEGNTGLAVWQHSFTKVLGWHFNIVFGAADAIHTPQTLQGNSCRKFYRHPSRPSAWAYGDQFQVIHTSSADLAGYDLLVYFRDSQHPAYLCSDVEAPIPGDPVGNLPKPPVGVPNVNLPWMGNTLHQVEGPMAIYAPPADSDGYFEVSWTSARHQYPSTGLFSNWTFRRYVLEMSTNPNFTTRTTAYIGTSNQFRPYFLQEGTYYFRVRAEYQCTGGFLGSGPQCGNDYPKSAYVGPNVTRVLN